MPKKNFKNELDVLRDVSGKLMSAGISFMLTGSMAMNYYAQPRMTRDIDIILSINKRDIERILTLFKKEYYISRDAVIESVENNSMFNIVHNESIIKVDFIILKEQEYRYREFERRQRVKIMNFETYIVSKEDLILSKILWAKDSRSEFQIKMDDTHPLIKAEVRRRLLSLSGESRMIMGSGMFDAAREMALASMPAGLTDSEWKGRLFLRFYSHDFDKRRLEAIVNSFKDSSLSAL